MSSGTAKERLFDLSASVSKMVLDGVRSAQEVSAALQTIIDGSSVFFPPTAQFWSYTAYNAWLEASYAEHAIPDDEMAEMKIRLLGLPEEAMVFYCHRDVDKRADVVLTSQLAWEYACTRFQKTWKHEDIVFSPARMKLADREPATPVGFYTMRLPERDRSTAIGRRFQREEVQSVRQNLGQDWGMAHEGIQIVGITHPHYSELMDGNKIPFIDLPGLAVDPSGVGGFRDAPYLNFSGGELGLRCDRVEHAASAYGSGSLQQCS